MFFDYLRVLVIHRYSALSDISLINILETGWPTSPASNIIGAIGGASPKPGNGEGCVRKGIWHKIIASPLLF
jgi:hypothetical protein